MNGKVFCKIAACGETPSRKESPKPSPGYTAFITRSLRVFSRTASVRHALEE
jgi:hypothetical protein